MKNTIIGCFGLGTFILFGCTQLHDQQAWKVKNDSDSDIFVEFTHEFDSETKLDTVGVGEEKLIYYKEGIAQGEDIEDPTQFVDVLIYNNTDTLVKDENLKSNWSVVTEEIGSNNEVLKSDYLFSVFCNEH